MGKDKKTFLNEFNTVKNTLESQEGIKKKNDEILAAITADVYTRKNAITAAFFSGDRKEALTDQFKSLLSGPATISKEDILNWVSKNLDAFALLSNNKICDNINDRDFQSYRKQLTGSVKIIQNWFDLYDKYGDILLNDDGGFDLSKADPYTEKDMAQIAFNKSNNDFIILINTITATNLAKDLTPEKADAYLKKFTYEEKDNYRTGKFILAYSIIKEYPDNKDLIGKCLNAVNKLTKAGKKDPVFMQFAESEEYDKMADTISSAEFRLATDIAKERSSADRQVIGDFAKDLAEAAKSTSRDSSEFKEIVAWANFIRDGADFTSHKFPKETRDQLIYMTISQKEALPLYVLHSSLEKYLEHKAKDGVKRNTYNKLAVVEKMYQYISKRIKEIDPEDFKFSIKNAKYEFKQRDVHETYAAEFKAQHARNEGLVDHAQKHNIDTLREAADKSAELQGFSINREELDNVNSCMNRIILKAQKAQIKKHPEIKTLDLMLSLSDLNWSRLDFFGNPMKPFKQSAEVQQKEDTVTKL